MSPSARRTVNPSIAILIGARGNAVSWPRALAFLGALVAADVVWFLLDLLRGGGAPPWSFWLVTIGSEVVMAAVAVVAFRFVDNAIAAAAGAAAVYALVMTPIRVVLTFGGSTEWIPFSAANAFVWVLAFMSGLALVVPRVAPSWLALGLGAAAGQLVAQLVRLPLLRLRVGEGVVLSWKEQLIALLLDLVGATAFAAVFWSGLRLTGFRGEAEEPPVPRMPATGRVAELQRAANFRTVRRLLRPAGIGSILFGVIAVGVGASTLREQPLNGVLLLLGLFLLGEGIWIVASPSPAGMIVDGIALIALGGWNILVTVVNASQGGGGGPHFFAVLGVMQIIWGFQSFARHRRFAALPMGQPSREAMAWLDEAVKDLGATRPQDAPDCIEFRVKGAKAAPGGWKGKLFPGMALVLGGVEVIVSGKDETEVTPQGAGASGTDLEARFALGGQTLEGTISQASLDAFRRWKAAPPSTAGAP